MPEYFFNTLGPYTKRTDIALTCSIRNTVLFFCFPLLSFLQIFSFDFVYFYFLLSVPVQSIFLSSLVFYFSLNTFVFFYVFSSLLLLSLGCFFSIPWLRRFYVVLFYCTTFIFALSFFPGSFFSTASLVPFFHWICDWHPKKCTKNALKKEFL